MFENIANAVNIVLCVIGISTPYPNVEFINTDIYQSEGIVYVEMDTSGLTNPAIIDLIRSGVSVNYEYSIHTESGSGYLYEGSEIHSVAYEEGVFVLGDSLNYYNEDSLESALSQITLAIHPDAEITGDYTSEIEIFIYGEELPNLSDLWGNQPLLILNYRL